MDFVKNPKDMNELFNKEGKSYDACIILLCKNVEEIVQRVTEFMVHSSNFSFFLTN
jgi:hypothetical protein